jgi:preprotein translocase subunit SecD
MLDFPPWKKWGIWLIILAGILLSIPSLLPEKTTATWPSWIHNTRIALGLDLAGGSHILLEADVTDLRKTRMENMEKTVRTVVRGERGSNQNVAITDLRSTDGKVSFVVTDQSKVDDVRDRLFSQTNGAGLTGQRDWDIDVVDDNRFILTPTPAGLTQAVDEAMEAATSVVRKRIDEMGTREPTIIRQGSDRIVVQVPGLDDPKMLKELLGRTARLEFKMVKDPAELDPTSQQALQRGQPPIGYEILPGAPGEQQELVDRQVMISGDQLIDAQQGFDQKDGRPVVDISFNAEGANTFAKISQNNVGKRFAMILDGVVLSAPSFNEPILGGRAQISGRFSVESANQLAIALRSGALPVKLAVVEERTVGPDLGRDSIQKGTLAAIVATLALILFMLVTYMRFGVYTTMALIVNAFLILGAMAFANATLTLPGIAGFVLTIGAAVDANVLINERIREEIRRGRRTIQAVEFGYKEASRAIFDANITNVISAVIMFWFGSGPIRGFAVVLAIGIITSVFTGVTFTRLIVAEYLRKARPKELVI